MLSLSSAYSSIPTSLGTINTAHASPRWGLSHCCFRRLTSPRRDLLRLTSPNLNLLRLTSSNLGLLMLKLDPASATPS